MATYKLKRKALGARVIPPLLSKLADFIGAQVHGSLGWFEGPTIEPLVGKAMPARLVKEAIVFAWLPDGERVVVVPSGAIVLAHPDGTCRLLAPSAHAFALAWAKGTSGVTTFDHDGSLLVERHGNSAASMRSVPSARKQLAAWLKKQKVTPPVAFDLDAYLGTAPRVQVDEVPAPSKKLVAGLVAGKNAAFAAYGAELVKRGHPLGAVIVADAAAIAEPKGKRTAKLAAKAVFLAYVKAHLEPRYARLAGNMVHFTDPAFPHGLGFRYGFLDAFDSFGWTTQMVTQARTFLEDDHARWVRDLTPRGMTFDDLALFARFPALRRLNFRWSKVEAVRSFAPLATLPLQALDIRGAGCADVAPLRTVPLVQLYLEGTKVVDLEPLAQHPTLECLELGKTAVADIRPLTTCPRLCNVNLWDTEVSDADAQVLIDALQRRKPKPRYADYLISGYSPGVSHPGPMWVT